MELIIDQEDKFKGPKVFRSSLGVQNAFNGLQSGEKLRYLKPIKKDDGFLKLKAKKKKKASFSHTVPKLCKALPKMTVSHRVWSRSIPCIFLSLLLSL